MLKKTISIKTLIILIVLLFIFLVSTYNFQNKTFNATHQIEKNISASMDLDISEISIFEKAVVDNTLLVMYTYSEGYGIKVYKKDDWFRFLYFEISDYQLIFDGMLYLTDNNFIFQTNKSSYVIFWGYNPNDFNKLDIDINSSNYDTELMFTYNYSSYINYYFEIEKIDFAPYNYDQIEVIYD